MAEGEHPQTEAARKQLAVDREALEKSRQQYGERMKGKPTPTQEENDLAMLGAPVFEKEDDGSGPDPNVRSMEAGKPAAGYQTRQAQARPAPPPRTTA
jgi:hypothetical protein